jgi:hypothetical protein
MRSMRQARARVVVDPGESVNRSKAQGTPYGWNENYHDCNRQERSCPPCGNYPRGILRQRSAYYANCKRRGPEQTKGLDDVVLHATARGRLPKVSLCSKDTQRANEGTSDVLVQQCIGRPYAFTVPHGHIPHTLVDASDDGLDDGPAVTRHSVG